MNKQIDLSAADVDKREDQVRQTVTVYNSHKSGDCHLMSFSFVAMEQGQLDSRLATSRYLRDQPMAFFAQIDDAEFFGVQDNEANCFRLRVGSTTKPKRQFIVSQLSEFERCQA